MSKYYTQIIRVVFFPCMYKKKMYELAKISFFYSWVEKQNFFFLLVNRYFFAHFFKIQDDFFYPHFLSLLVIWPPWIIKTEKTSGLKKSSDLKQSQLFVEWL